MEEMLKEEVRKDLEYAGPRFNIDDVCHVIVARAECMSAEALITPLVRYAENRIRRENERCQL